MALANERFPPPDPPYENGDNILTTEAERLDILAGNWATEFRTILGDADRFSGLGGEFGDWALAGCAARDRDWDDFALGLYRKDVTVVACTDPKDTGGREICNPDRPLTQYGTQPLTSLLVDCDNMCVPGELLRILPNPTLKPIRDRARTPPIPGV
jgi:hypothetical protein